MTHRYITKVYWGNEPEREIPTSSTSMTIFEDDNTPIRTGLLDQYGNPLYRVLIKSKMGFQVRDKEEE